MNYRISGCACCVAPATAASTRRAFLTGGAALAAGAFCPPRVARAAESSPVIDTHFHLFPPDVVSLQQKLNPAWANISPPRRPDEVTPARMIADMDQRQLSGVIASPPTPGPWFGDRDGARRIQRAFNEYAAQFARDNPKRVGFLAMISPPDVEGSLKEIEYAFDVLKADGVAIYSNYGDKYPGDVAFAPVFDELHRRKAAVLVHPNTPNCCSSVLPGVAPSLIEYGFDLTRAVASLLFGGTLGRCPDVKFIFSQGGGAFPIVAAKIEEVASASKSVRDATPGGVGEALRRLYVDTAGATSPLMVSAILKYAERSHVLFGTDYPYGSWLANFSGIEENHLPEDVRRAIQQDNARALFPRFRA